MLQSWHISPRKRDAREKPKDHGTPKAFCQQRKTERAHHTHYDAKEIDPLGIHSVGETDQQRHRYHITGEVDATDPARLGIAQIP